jgi:S-adenosylmethionine synthetase
MALFTSESVTEGHPDKVCDQIADRILDEIIAKDKKARVACEVFITTGLVIIGGEISTKVYVDIPNIVKETLRNIGYTNKEYGFDCGSCGVLVAIDEQSPDIALGVDVSLEFKEGEIGKYINGAGDQGMMFGYACDQTSSYMPMPIYLAHKLSEKLSIERKNSNLDFLRPDGKTQVTINYNEKGQIFYVDTIIISAQHEPNVEQNEIRDKIIENVVKTTIPERLMHSSTKIFVNSTGKFVIGGPMADSGLTGRKIMVDTYGGYARHGGGAFSGKDPTKVDRSGAYFARFIAKNIVANRLAQECEIQIAYAIGVAKPVSVRVETFGKSKISCEKIENLIVEKFDMRPAAMIERLNLLRPIYSKTSVYGHFGREDVLFPWEEIIEF